MGTLAEIESALKTLPLLEQKELFRRLAERLQHRPEVKRRLPLVPATGRPITQQHSFRLPQTLGRIRAS